MASPRMVQSVQLSIQLKGVASLDFLSKSDVFCVCYVGSNRSGPWAEIGRTETIWNDNNPTFKEVIKTEYHFERTQWIRIEAYDNDDAASTRLADHDYVGEIVLMLSQIMSSGLVFKTHLHPKSMGHRGHAPPAIAVANTPKSHALARQPIMIVSAAAVKNGGRDLIDFEAEAVGVSGGCGGGECTLLLQRKSTTGAVVTTHKVPSVPIVAGSAKFRRQKVRLGTLALGDQNMTIQASVQVDGCGGLGEAGRVEFTAAKWAELGATGEPGGRAAKVKTVKGGAGSSTPSSCTLTLHKWTLTECPPLINYLGGGLDINLVVAVDFTASNGPPSNSSSLHYIGGAGGNNQYLEAMSTIGTIVQEYGISDVPAYGFGAQLPGQGEANHCFPLTLDPRQPTVRGLDGVRHAYQNAVRSVQLWGPTNFAPIINRVAEIASQREAGMLAGGPLAFEVLLILTDGVITDLPDTISAIIRASKLPMAIIIVGVGGADFEAMDYLDADDGMLKDMYGNEAARDIVQFVPMRQYLGRDRWALAADTLKELPDQIVDYFVMKKIPPRPVPEPHGAGGAAAGGAGSYPGAGAGGDAPGYPGGSAGGGAGGPGLGAPIPAMAQSLVSAVGHSGPAGGSSQYPTGGAAAAGPGYPGGNGGGYPGAGPGYPGGAGVGAGPGYPGTVGPQGVQLEMGATKAGVGPGGSSLPYPTGGASGEAGAPRTGAAPGSGSGGISL